MIINQKLLEKIVNNIKGKELTFKLINDELKKLGFKKLPDVTIQNGYVTERGGWVTLKILQNSIRIELDNNNIVIE